MGSCPFWFPAILANKIVVVVPDQLLSKNTPVAWYRRWSTERTG